MEASDQAPLGHDWIAARIPHSGAMCLLDAIVDWDAEQVRCVATSHLSADNPLRAKGRLASVCAVDYAAQAMAAHGALVAGNETKPRAGMLTSVRGVRTYVERLDTLGGPLTVQAQRIGGDENTVLYRFEVKCEGRQIIDGRAAVMLDAQSSLTP
jgi:predicted hotdog family 3-hydroxylacyl-ACP dehydratase